MRPHRIVLLLFAATLDCSKPAPRENKPPPREKAEERSPTWLNERMLEPRSGKGRTVNTVEVFELEVVATYPHDVNSHTEGLEIHDGELFESTGLAGFSALLQVERASGKIVRRKPLPGGAFGEGFTFVGGRAVVLTLHEHVAYFIDAKTFEHSEIRYEKELWGVCYDGKHLIVSDGSDTLSLRDPDTLREASTLRVHVNGRTFWMGGLNELECVGDLVYANADPSDFLVRIDRRSGDVTGIIDTRSLPYVASATHVARSMHGHHMNGIAYDKSRGTFLLTGKAWPELYEVRFVSAGVPTFP